MSIHDLVEALGLTSAWTYLAIFVGTSLLMLWRLDALLKHGLEGTALGTLVMPYCSGLGNLAFVAIVAMKHAPPQDVLTNCLVNNVTNLTLVLGLPALCWGLTLGKATKKAGAKKKNPAGGGDEERQLTRLSLLLTLAAVAFFTGITWMLGSDGTLDRNDGLALIALFLFWQCFQVFDVLKHNVRRRQSFSGWFYFDLVIVLIGAYGVYGSLDWIVGWLQAQKGGFVNAAHLGWITGWLMVLPNALLAFYYAARGRADIAFASQVGDGHICIPLCIGISAALSPIKASGFFEIGLAILIGATVVHAVCIIAANGLPRWMGWPLLAGYAWFLFAGLS